MGVSAVYSAASKLRSAVNKAPGVLAGKALKWGVLKPIQAIAMGTAALAYGGYKLTKAATWNPVTRYVGREIVKPFIKDAGKKFGEFGAGMLYGTGKAGMEMLGAAAWETKIAAQAGNKTLLRNTIDGVDHTNVTGKKIRSAAMPFLGGGAIAIGVGMSVSSNQEEAALTAMENPNIKRAGTPNSIDNLGATGDIVLASHKLRKG